MAEVKTALVCRARSCGGYSIPTGVLVVSQEAPLDKSQEEIGVIYAADAQAIHALFIDCLPVGTFAKLTKLMVEKGV